MPSKLKAWEGLPKTLFLSKIYKLHPNLNYLLIAIYKLCTNDHLALIKMVAVILVFLKNIRSKNKNMPIIILIIVGYCYFIPILPSI